MITHMCLVSWPNEGFYMVIAVILHAVVHIFRRSGFRAVQKGTRDIGPVRWRRLLIYYGM